LKTYDLVIVGGGIVGLTTALAIAAQSSLSIAIIESKPFLLLSHSRESGNPSGWISTCTGMAGKVEGMAGLNARVSAISLSSQYILQNLGCSDFVKSPYRKMTVWEKDGEVHFEDADVLGYIVEDALLRKSLMRGISRFSNITFLSPYQLKAIDKKLDHIELISDEENLQTKFVIAADGANSWVRETLQMPLKHVDYEQTAIVATVQTEFPHQKTAWQRFLASGPLAFLPLKDSHQCSIVWSAKHAIAEDLLKDDEENFLKKLGEAFQHKLGKILTTSSRMHFPLRMRHAKNYVQEGIALVGDAAHTIHPLAGYGVNLGLLDAVTLAEVVTKAYVKGRRFESFHTLRQYERWRKNETFTMIAMVNWLNQLFLSENTAIQSLRNAGLNITDRMGWLKKIITNYALGKRSELPRFARMP